MNKFSAAAGALIALGLSATASSAAPYTGAGKLTSGFDAGVIQVHGVHRECVRGRFGWHRSTPWGGRLVCRPHFQRWDGDRHDGHHGGRGRDDDRHDGRGRDHDRNDDRPARRIPRGSY